MENIQAVKRMPQTKMLSLSQSWRNSINLCIIAYKQKSCGEQSPQLFYKNNLLNDNFLTIGTDIQPTALPSTAHKKYTAACDALAHLLIKK